MQWWTQKPLFWMLLSIIREESTFKPGFQTTCFWVQSQKIHNTQRLRNLKWLGTVHPCVKFVSLGHRTDCTLELRGHVPLAQVNIFNIIIEHRCLVSKSMRKFPPHTNPKFFYPSFLIWKQGQWFQNTSNSLILPTKQGNSFIRGNSLLSRNTSKYMP